MEAFERLQAAGAVLQGHFVYRSGSHGPHYVNIDPIFTDPVLMGQFARALAGQFFFDFDAVVGPAVGGIVLATLISQALAAVKPVPVWADKVDQQLRIERAGFANALQGKRVLVVEDLLTTGGSVMAVCREVERCGGSVIGVSVIWNRGGITAAQLGVPRLEALCNMLLPAFSAQSCQLCQQQVPIVDNIGYGSRWKEQLPDYAGGYISLAV